MRTKGRTAPQYFPSTRWTNIRTLQEMDSDERRAALSEFVRQYQPAIESYIRHVFRSISHEQAEEFAQAFTVDKIITQDLIAKAASERGKLRNFIKTAVKNYCLTELGRRAAVNHTDLGQDWVVEPDRMADAENAMDVSWAAIVVEEALRRTRERMMTRSQEITWAVFERRVVRPAKGVCEEEQYEQIEAELGRTRRELRNRLAKAKTVYASILRDVVHEYVADESDIDDELSALVQLVDQ